MQISYKYSNTVFKDFPWPKKTKSRVFQDPNNAVKHFPGEIFAHTTVLQFVINT